MEKRCISCLVTFHGFVNWNSKLPGGGEMGFKYLWNRWNNPDEIWYKHSCKRATHFLTGQFRLRFRFQPEFPVFPIFEQNRLNMKSGVYIFSPFNFSTKIYPDQFPDLTGMSGFSWRNASRTHLLNIRNGPVTSNRLVITYK